MQRLEFPNKRLRAYIIKEFVKRAGYPGVVCFSCGNASAALKAEGLDVVDVSARGELSANKWWTPEDIHRVWPDRFDATSGHLPVYLMEDIGQYFKMWFENPHCPEYAKPIGEGPYEVPCGSGETLVCLKLAYPTTVFHAVYDNSKPETKWEPSAPLNPLVQIMAESITRKN